jgi:hypothetical protein
VTDGVKEVQFRVAQGHVQPDRRVLTEIHPAMLARANARLKQRDRPVDDTPA